MLLVLASAGRILGQTVCTQIMVDQFGYRTGAKKVAVFADPELAEILADPEIAAVLADP